MPFDVAKVLAERHGENFELHGELHEPPDGPGPAHARLRPLLRPGRGLLPLRRRRRAVPRPAVGLRRLRPRPVPPRRSRPPSTRPSTSTCPTWSRSTARSCPACWPRRWSARAHDGIRRVFFCNSGTEAVEAAIKFARYATKRPRIVYADHAFHGLSTGALALNGGADFRQGFGPLLAEHRGPLRRHRRACAASSRRGDVAAFVVEPIQGKGVHVAPAEYWHEVQRALPALQDPARRRRGADRARPDRPVLLPRALGARARHHHGVQGAVGRASSRSGAILVHREGVHERVQLDGPGDGALEHLRPQPAGDGGRPGHAAGDRRRGHRRAGPDDRRVLRGQARPARRALRDAPRGPGPRAHDRPRVRPAHHAPAPAPLERRSSGSARRCSPRPSSCRCSTGTGS